MKNQKLRIDYDRQRDVLYVHLGGKATVNIPWDLDEDICFDPKSSEVTGYVITNFSKKYPKLAGHSSTKDKWFIRDFFIQRLRDWSMLLSQFKSKKALIHFLTHEHSKPNLQFAG